MNKHDAYAPLRLQMAGGVATVTLSEPARGNPFDSEFCGAFRSVVLELWNTSGLRAVHLRAEGENFSYGGDIKPLYAAREDLSGPVRVVADLGMTGVPNLGLTHYGGG
jgi:2-(1,2-epoxy-1,2-dihydrophenyl)acetyl-CoA isomerase